MMRLLVALTWFAVISSYAAMPFALVRTVISSTGQFVVQGPPPTPGYPTLRDTTTNRIVRLDAVQLSVTCERIKAAFLRELNIADQVVLVSKIHVNILAYARADQPVNIGVFRYPDGWRYQIDLPEQIAPERLIRGVVQVLLTELANRRSLDRSAEVPLWLVEGVTRQLLLAYKLELILQPQTITIASIIRADPLTVTRELLRQTKPLTFAELSEPNAEQLSPGNVEVYQACAQFLFVQLERLPGGDHALAEFLSLSQQNLNWQVALLRAYRRHFRSLLDIEKWWALSLINFTGRDPSQVWSADRAHTKLGELLRVSVRVANRSNAIPRQVEYTLQGAVTNLAYPQQRGLLGQKVNQLIAARVNVPNQLLPLLDAYQKTLENYIYRRDRAGYAPVRKGQPYPSTRIIVDDAIRQLDELDRRRQPLPAAPGGTQAGPAP